MKGEMMKSEKSEYEPIFCGHVPLNWPRSWGSFWYGLQSKDETKSQATGDQQPAPSGSATTRRSQEEASGVRFGVRT
jgi:hypothetical protein